MELMIFSFILFLSIGYSQIVIDKINEPNPNCTSRKFFQCQNNPNECVSFTRRFCNGESDCSDRSDETEYDPAIHSEADGISCLNLVRTENTRYIKNCFLPSRYVGDQIAQCDLGEDECGFPHAFQCRSSPEPQDVPHQCITRTQFCDGVLDCFADRGDERSFIPGLGDFKCPVSKLRQEKTCDLPRWHVCDGYSDCQFAIDECFCDNRTYIENSFSNDRCFRCLDGNFVIPQQQLCDGKFHCDDLSDECMCEDKPQVCNEICKVGADCRGCAYGQVSCGKAYESDSEVCIDRAQVCDGVFDCPLKEDEKNCNVVESDLFTCQDQSMYILKQQFCDNITDCGDGSDEANCSSVLFECNPTSIYFNTVRPFAYEVFRPRFTVACDSVPLCEDFEDECNSTLCGNDLPQYCNPDLVQGIRGFVCPDNATFELIGAEICDGFPNCNVNAPETSADELYCPKRVYCDDYGKEKLPIHIPESAECDGKRDCFDESDELNCSLDTHFYCNSNLVKFVPRSKVCDGIQDCPDGIDECQNCSVSPFSSDSSLINSHVLQVFIWIIGIISILGNAAVLVHNFSVFWTKGKGLTRISCNHRILVTNLATADLLLGIYLISLGVVNVRYEGVYCRRDIQWRASMSCVAMGTLAVISTEGCIFLLVTMATMRLCLVTQPFYKVIKRRYIVAGIVVSWIFALIIALVPLVPSHIDYFVSQVWYRNNPFLTLASRQQLRDVATYIWSLGNNASQAILNTTVQNDRSLTWTNMISTIRVLNETYHPTLYFGYYSAHGVCLPRLFPDPQLDRSWGFSLGVITLNFLAFVYMFVVYIIIYRVSAIQTRDAGRSDADVATSDLQRKITRVIFTNFCCWIPICILAFISATGNPLSPEIYAVSAIILLPINSAFNPLLYSDLPDFIWMKLIENTEFGRWMKRKKMARLSTSRRSALNAYRSKQKRSNGTRSQTQTSSPVTKTLSNEETRL